MKKLSNSVINDIASETHCNNHTGALWVLALELNSEWMVKELERIQDEHINTGYLTDALNFDRALASRVVMQLAENTYSNINEIKDAF
tara:strand:- start:134 stop:397 length:264 start_codon:yes stop_codon:yes gene_type:complete